MTSSLWLLCVTAASIGFLHTLFGPDHYLPFIVMKKARNWSFAKTLSITIACGLGHVLSSVVLGLIGIAAGIALMKLEVFESFRGNIAAWALIGFGFAYFLWGVRMAIRNKPHTHIHVHDDEKKHSHHHSHVDVHSHVHEDKVKSITPWILFVVFVLGPCEPLIPILMYPAAKGSLMGLILVTSVFGIVTLATMTGIVVIVSFGINLVPIKKIERYTHALAGAAICLSGMAIQFLGL
ncbi:MAG: sulfite exporter TauE/SafE family protein [Candidatus Orphnella occulta]|nr:sulfite exporter TauE/SafE family protein [Candidatus Orphnella occulta]